MNANKWYSIAQTTVFDTSCGINITFGDSSSVLFTASVKYGVSSLNISSCSIEESYNISVRLRETESKWCVDLLSNIEINPTIDITDSPYWIADNSLAGNGAVIAIIENISKEFNTTGGSGSGEGGESLFDRINIGTDANPQYAVVPKDFNGSYVHIVSRGDVLAGGEGTPGESGQGATTLGGLNNVDAGADEIYNTDKILVKPSLGSHWRVFDVSSIVGLDTNALKQYLDTNKYITETTLEDYATTDDITELSNSVSNLKTDFDNLNNLLNDDTSGVIDTWNEVVDFLNGYKESEDLATILSKMNEDIANRVLSTDFNSYKTTTDSRISALESLGLSIVVQNGKTYLKSEHSFCTEKDIFAGGLGEEGPSSGGIIQQVYGVSAFGGTFDANNLTDTFNAYAINSLYTTIQRGVKNPYALTINGTSYDGSSPVDITISGGGGGGTFNGGTITGKTTISTSGWGNQLVINRSEGNGAPSVAFSNVGNGILGYIGIGGTASSIGTKPFYEDASGNTYLLLHSGNYSSYALPLSGGTISSSHYQPLIINSTCSAVGDVRVAFSYNGNIKGLINWDSNTAFRLYNYVSACYIGVKDDGTPVYDNNTLIHSGNIGSYNAGSATKLQTARTIWGQSFDGSGNVSGDIVNAAGGVYIHRTNEINSFNGGLYLNHRGNGSATEGTTGNIVMCSNGGNVLVGLTNESGYRFQVSGVARFGGVTTSSLLVGYDSNCIEGVSPDGNITGNVWINSVSTGKTIMNVGGGNVLIGTTEDYGYKFQVKGHTLMYANTPNVLTIMREGNFGAYIDYIAANASSKQWRVGANESGAFVFENNNTGTATNSLSILANSNVLIGTTTDNGAKLQVNGDITATYSQFSNTVPIRFTSTGTGIYNIATIENSSSGFIIERARKSDSASAAIVPFIISQRGGGEALKLDGNNLTVAGDITAGSSASDMRLKDIVCNDYDAVSIIKNLSTFKYKWNSTAKSLTDCFSKDNYEHFGLSAQEVEKVSGYLVSNFNYGEGREYLTLKKDELVPVLVQAVKQLLTRIEILEGK